MIHLYANGLNFTPDFHVFIGCFITGSMVFIQSGFDTCGFQTVIVTIHRVLAASKAFG